MITLDQQDIEKINTMIQKTPFEFAYPLFMFFKTKIAESQTKQNELSTKSTPSGDKPDRSGGDTKGI